MHNIDTADIEQYIFTNMIDHTTQQRPLVGVHLVLIQDDRVLLMRRSVKNQMDGYYAFVAGKVDQFETPQQAAVREAYEEIGITIKPENLQYLTTVHHAHCDYKAAKEDVIEFYFVCRQWDGTPVNMEPEKASDLAFYPLNNLPAPLPRGAQCAFDSLTSGVAYWERT